jgi:sterol desaturase/sphingolipid hydroxylase (fatty acid hydroxylase superfamily)
MNAPLAAAATFVALDLTLWAWHRANHRLGFLWRFHRVHHSDVDFDVSTSLRFHAGELLLSIPPKGAVVILLGAPVAGVLAFEVVFGLFNMLVHGNLRLPARVEAALASLVILPAVHRRHHSIERADRNANFGTVLSLWDRLFGTGRAGRSSDPIATGLPELGLTPRPATDAPAGSPPTLWRCLVLPLAPLDAENRAGALEQGGQLR